MRQVLIAKGKKVLRFEATARQKADILSAVMGPSGNLRAPSLLADKTLWVGFNEELYGELQRALAG